MVAIYTPGTVTISAWYDIQAPHLVANVTNWHTAATGLTAAQLTAIQTAFDNSWVTWIKPLLAATAFYKGCKVIDMSSNMGLMADNASYVGQAGTGTGGPVGDSNAFLLSFKEVMRYRGGHSRIYIPGFATSQAAGDGRQWLSGVPNTVQVGWNSTVTALAGISPANGGPLTPVVWHKHHGTQQAYTNPIATAVGSVVYANQRRRLRKVSRHRKKTTTP